MTLTYNTTITKLYFLLIYADGKVNAREVASARQMIKAEGISDTDFHNMLEDLKTANHESLLNDCITSIKLLDRTQQIRIVAWLCVLANADGFMDRSEWQLIYRIYHTELKLPLNEIFTVQKDLNRIVWLTPQSVNP
jgi:uncharacterized tellurite resistance protein B-like protein